MKINIKFLNNKAIPTFVFFTALTGGLLYHLKEQKLHLVTIQKVLGWKSLTDSKITIY